MSPWLADKHTRPRAVCVSALHRSTSNVCHVRTSISDTVMRPSVIDSVCAARPLFFLGDAITELNAYTTGSVHICGPARLRAADLYGTLLFPEPEGGGRQKVKS